MGLAQVVEATIPFLSAYSVLFGVLLLFAYLLSNKYRYGIAKLPGPALAAYTDLWRIYIVGRFTAHLTSIKLHRQYGPLVRTGPNHVSVGDPNAIPIIYGLNKGFTKTAFYPIQSIVWQKKPEMNLFSERDEAAHVGCSSDTLLTIFTYANTQLQRDQRKQVASAYGLSSLLEMEGAVDSCTTLFMSRLAEFASTNKPVDLGAWMQFYAFDVVGELTFDLKLGFLDKGSDVDGMMAAIKALLIYATICGQVPYMHEFLLGNPMWRYLIPGMENWNAVLNFALKAINSRGSIKRDDEEMKAEEGGPGGSAGKDQLSRWYALKLAAPSKLSTRDIIVHTSGNVFAGSDTTAIILRGVIYFLCKNPSAMARVVEEITAADAAGLLSNPITYKESITHLPYTHATLKETMRIHPSVGLLLERHVPPGGATICGEHIPGNTVVGVNAWVLQHDAAVFPDPGAFRPERWLLVEGRRSSSTEEPSSKQERAKDEERLREMEQRMFVFGAGARTCIGKNMSLIKMAKVVPQLLREFEVELVDREGEWRVRNHWFVQQEGVVCWVKRRRPSGK